MLVIDATTVRLFLHVLSATVWVGGQIVLGGLVPTVRTLGPDAPRLVARRFNVIAWPAFGVLLATGVWNLLEIDLGAASSAYQARVLLKLALVALSGTGAAVHIVGRSKAALAFGGAASSLGAVGALALGVML